MRGRLNAGWIIPIHAPSSPKMTFDADSVCEGRRLICLKSRAVRSITKWFETSAFKVADAGTLSSLGRNVVIGPGMNNWDASLQKWFRVGERLKPQFRAEFFDAPNHLSFWDVGTTVGSTNFGQVTTATDPRILQFAIRITF
jgi:hypothetical protein